MNDQSDIDARTAERLARQAAITAAVAEAKPTSQSQRFLALDATRGFALFGIVLVNVLMGAQSINIMSMPWLMDWLGEEDIASWAAISVFMMGAARCMFGLMFGAGMVMIMDRLSERYGHKPAARLYFRRLWILLFIGFVDMLLFMWWGDILFLYALCGMVVYLYRNVRTWIVLLNAAIFMSISTLIIVAMMSMMGGMVDQYPAVQAAIEAGETLTAEQKMVQANIGPMMDKAIFDADIAISTTGSFGEVYVHILTNKTIANLMMGLIFASWDSLFAMLVGVAMYRVGWLTGEARMSTCAWMTVIGLGLGLGLRYWIINNMLATDFAREWSDLNMLMMQPGRMLVAIGFVGLIQLLAKMPWAAMLSRGFAAMGQMALTGYLGQSIIYLVLYYSFGAGLYGQMGGFDLWWFALAIYVAQVIFSVYWLKTYRFGPFEWLWRSWTYKKKMPMRR